jgi:precorrin-6B C5,15-methyltransferase / cobalt-precorrin-6B C5,C15-methyltransferase
MKNPISVIGLGCSTKDLTSAHLNQIHQSDILVGGRRSLECFNEFRGDKVEITKDLKGLIQFIRGEIETKKISVVASGDPLFYGIGSRLIESLGRENVMIFPNISMVSAAFSRIKDTWHDAHVISLHGRESESELLWALKQKDKIAVYTDPKKNPAWLAKFLFDHQVNNYAFWVFEQLGSASEKIGKYSLEAASRMQFNDPNILVLIRNPDKGLPVTPLTLGMPDQMFAHYKGLITKAEVRSVTLSKLQLESDHILWDLGAGSGSVSIEASLFIKKGKIIAIEQQADRVKDINENKKRFGVVNLDVIHGILPFDMEKLPIPDRIFIGGGGKDLSNIIKSAGSYLKNNGIMVINTVLIQNVENALKTLKHMGMRTDIIQVQVSRQMDMPWGEMLKAQNPVWIITGTGKGERS